MRRVLCDTSMGQVHCLTEGHGAASPLLLLHQTPRSVDEFAEVMPILAGERRVVAIDTPGYGCSDRVPGEPEIADYARVAVEVLDALGIGRAIPVGHHTGAVIAVELASAFPERIERVVLSGPVYTDAAGRAGLERLFRQWSVQPDGTHLTEKWRKLHDWLPRPDLVQRFVVDLFRAGTASEQGHFAVARYRMEDRLPLVRCPALLLYGARDSFARAERSGPFRSAFRPCVEVTIDAGVFAANERPDLFAAAVLDYLRGSHPAGPR